MATVTFIFYSAFKRLTYIDVKSIFKSYIKVFVNKVDLIFFIIIPLFLTIASLLYKEVDNNLANLIAVVLSILTSMVLTFMAMTNEKYVNNLDKEEKNISDLRLKIQNEDAIAVGMYEILISIIVLVLIFVRPAIETKRVVILLVSFFIYYGFYVFLLNILIMVRRLYQVCCNAK